MSDWWLAKINWWYDNSLWSPFLKYLALLCHRLFTLSSLAFIRSRCANIDGLSLWVLIAHWHRSIGDLTIGDWCAMFCCASFCLDSCRFGFVALTSSGSVVHQLCPLISSLFTAIWPVKHISPPLNRLLGTELKNLYLTVFWQRNNWENIECQWYGYN